ncbi:MAG: cadmium-translocating P-type ATPase [Clostridium sp.]|nr:cadmium-translocating P-type ATPase [Clostridium sp.]
MANEHKHKHNEHCDCCNHEHQHNEAHCGCEHEHHHHEEHCGCGHEHHHHEHGDGCGCGHDHAHEELNKKDFAFKVGFGGALLVIGYILSELTEKGTLDIPSFAYLICFGISYLIVGFTIIKEAVEGIIHGDIFNENFLMSIASIGAFAVGEYTEGCAVMFLFTIGEFLQSLAVQRSRKSIKNMLELQPTEVTVIRDGKEITVQPEDVKIGEQMIIKPGEKIDIDGKIVSGSAEVDMKALTGESIPVTKAVGDEVLAGSVNIDGAITVEAVKEYKDSTVAKILDMLEDAEDKKSHAEHFITRFARIYTPIVCLIALLIILIPPLFLGGEWKEWIYRGLSALVVSCPCALVISIPLSFFGGIGACSKEGILVKGSNYLEALANADTGVFDKTGTITSGKFEYVKCECHNCHCSDNSHRELLKIIAACERYSTHPIAKSISLAFGHYADECEVQDAKNYAGKGVSAIVDGVKYYVGNDKLMQDIGIDFEETSTIGTAVYCATDSEFKGDIVFADIIKQDSKDAIAQLKKQGIAKTIMLTGDKEPIAKDIAEKAGVDDVYAKLLPADKVARVKELQASGANVLYTGDGINDAPVLAQADLGVAMGGAGSDVAIEASDMVIMGDSLSKLSVGRRIAKKTVNIVRQNIIFSLAVKILIIIGCAVGIFDENAMWLAVFGDVGVCLIAIANAMRTLIVKKK